MSSTDPRPGAPSDAIELSEIHEDRITTKVMSSGRKAVALRCGGEVKVFGELCPHMGADMSEATYCSKTGTLTCKWHGYVFGADDGAYRSNPNEQMMKVLRVPSRHYRPEKTPKYRLRTIPYEIKGGRVYLGGGDET
jgi:nitrite reductase/ring-hydroxylating ferredoxin subunit